MSAWEWVGDSAGFLLLLVLLYGVALVLRRRVLSRHGGTFELSVRMGSPQPDRGWVLGLGRYGGNGIEWFRIFSLSPWPKRSWRRGALVYESQRETEGREQVTVYAGHVVVVCRAPDGLIEMAMSPSALTGLQSWLEAAPPGAPSPHDL